jgi:hypothetical protein
MLFLIGLTAVSVFLMKTEKAGAADGITIPLSVSYNSTYWWRGVELNGRNVGVLWLGVGAELGDTGLALQFFSALSQDYLVQSDDSSVAYKNYHDTQKSLTEFDYGVSYAKEIEGLVNIEAALYYIQYAFYDEVNSSAVNPSFIEASLALEMTTILSPKISLYYDYYVDERIGADGKETPVNQDYYLNFSLSQTLLEAQGFRFGLSAWVGYYNNAYLEAEGWSDAGINAALSFESGATSFEGSFNYARSLSGDFQIEYTEADYPNNSVGVLKNHLWITFGVTYKI